MAQGSEDYTDELQSRYSELAIPVLICWGTDDGWLPPYKAEELAAAIPAAQLRWLSGAGHLVQEDAPAQLLAFLTEFLEPNVSALHQLDRLPTGLA